MPYKTQLEWLVKLAHSPGWREYAWHRAKELEADPTGLWTGIKQDLTRHMTGLGANSESANPIPTKPR